MKSGQQSGYTIVEMLIFITVSAGLFFGAMTAIGGRQAQVQFTQAVRNFDSQLTDILNDVSTGFFPGKESVTCLIGYDALTTDRPTITTTDAEQGTSDNCVFIGKVLQFAPAIDGQEDQNAFFVYTLVGRRTTQGGDTEVSSLAEANPIAVAPLAEPATLEEEEADFTTKVTLDWGLRVTRVVVPTPGLADFGGIGLFNTLSSARSADPISESQVLNMAGITNSTRSMTQYDFAALVNTITDDSAEGTETLLNLNPPEDIILCLASADGDRKAAITIDGTDRRLSTSVTFDQVDEAICV